MGKGSHIHPDHDDLQEYTWEEIREHGTKDDMWIAISMCTMSRSGRRGIPGGDQLLIDLAGEDATLSLCQDGCLLNLNIIVKRLII